MCETLSVCRRVREVGLRRKKTEKKLWLYFLFLAVLLFSIAKFCITNYFKICFSKFIIATDIVLCFALTVSRYLCCTKSPSNLNIAPTAMGTPSAFKVPVRNEQHPVQVVTVSSSDAIPMCNEGKTVLLIQCMVSGEIGEEAGKISCTCTTYRQSKKNEEIKLDTFKDNTYLSILSFQHFPSGHVGPFVRVDRFKKRSWGDWES